MKLVSEAEKNLVKVGNGADLPADTGAVIPVTNPLLAQWATLMFAEGLSRRTVKDRMFIVARMERDLATPAPAVSTAQVAEWLARDGLAAVTKSVYHSILSAYFRYLVDQGVRDDNPMLKIKAARRPRRYPRPITRTQFDRLLDTADRELKAMMLLAGLAGLRVHEVARFSGRHLDAEARTLDVIGKGGAAYTLPAHDALIAHATLMPAGVWFPSQRAKHIGGRTVTERMRLHMIRQRVPGTPHALRHFYGTELVSGGADLRVAQELLRHSSLQTTAIYVKTSDTRKRDAIDRLFADAVQKVA